MYGGPSNFGSVGFLAISASRPTPRLHKASGASGTRAWTQALGPGPGRSRSLRVADNIPQSRAASGGEFRRGEITEGPYKAYKGMVEGYIQGIQGLCKAPPLVTPLL